MEASKVKKEKIWVLREQQVAPDAGEVEALAAATGLSAICARLLYCRGYRTAEAVERFLRCEDTMFHSPFLLRDVRAAVARIRRAVEGAERIVIYGDYDVDGVTAVSLLYLYLKRQGADVRYYIPSRSQEGYGLSTAAIDRLAAEGVQCIITVDTGITADAEVLYAKELGIDMVITDHHECRETLPEAVAVVNPHRSDCPYPFKELAGVGVIFKVMTAYECTLGMERGEKEIDGVRRMAHDYADLVAIGTIADVMPITDENRLIVTLGLSRIAATGRAGLAALIEEASAGKGENAPRKKKKITSSFIGFGLAPRINAAGRMSEATIAVELLLCEEPERARALAAELCEINRCRQVEENAIAEQAYARIEQEFDLDRTKVLVLEDDGWRQGIIGIVASRVTERYGLHAQFSPPTVIYKETPAAEGIAYADYLMPKPCWAIVKFRFEPMPRGYGVSYHGRLPSNQCFYRYQSHIHASFNDCLKQGLYGWEVTDFRCTLIGGEHHSIHTHPLDFFVCTPMAFMNGLQSIGVTLLEPMLNMRISVPTPLSGKVINEITRMGGEYDAPLMLGDITTIDSVVPAAASMDFPVKLTAMSSGKAVLNTTFSGYRECRDGIIHENPRIGVNPLDRSKWILWARGAYTLAQ